MNQLSCSDCRESFEFTEGEQKFYADKGFQPPRRCPACRLKKKAQASPAGARTPSPARETQWIGGGDGAPVEHKQRARRDRTKARTQRDFEYDD